MIQLSDLVPTNSEPLFHCLDIGPDLFSVRKIDTELRQKINFSSKSFIVECDIMDELEIGAFYEIIFGDKFKIAAFTQVDSSLPQLKRYHTLYQILKEDIAQNQNPKASDLDVDPFDYFAARAEQLSKIKGRDKPAGDFWRQPTKIHSWLIDEAVKRKFGVKLPRW